MAVIAGSLDLLLGFSRLVTGHKNDTEQMSDRA
jgi:hypothetical protein